MSRTLQRAVDDPRFIKNHLTTHEKQKINTILVKIIIPKHPVMYDEANISIPHVIVTVFPFANIEDFLHGHN